MITLGTEPELLDTLRPLDTSFQGSQQVNGSSGEI